MNADLVSWEVMCGELISCGSFCVRCNKGAHSPFRCRQSSERLLRAGHEVDIFKKLSNHPDEVTPCYRVFVMKPRNESNFADPLDILYTTAEGTFLRMMKMTRAQDHGYSHVYGRSFIQQIKYFENDDLSERFESCKARLQAQGVSTKERLVFHGTSASVDSIMKEGFLLRKCKRFANGYGIYFSEFPEVSKVKGDNDISQ